MSTDTNSRDGNRKNQGRGGFRSRQAPRPEAWTKDTARYPQPECPLCHKPIAEISSAITEKDSGQPAHFDCILTRLVEIERPGPGERVVYLGGGSFAIADYGANPTGTKFTIKRKIQYEEKDKRAEWRRDVTNRTVI